MLRYRRIGLTVKSDLAHKDEAFERVLAVLESLGAEVRIDAQRCGKLHAARDLLPYAGTDDLDLLVVIGGDGTILRAVRELQNFSVPILSVNRGTVGFLAETELDEAETLLPKLLQGEGIIEHRSVLRVSARRAGRILFEGYALNEAVIAQGTIARLVDLCTRINGEELTSFHADGIIIATPTGSTAYALAAGGPIVHPQLHATILTPINPHSFSQKPVVLPAHQEVEVEVLTKPNKFRDIEVILTLDGQVYVPLKNGDTVQACACGKTVQFLRRSQDTFFATLRRKLKWGEPLER